MSATAWVVLGALAALGLWAVAVYNRLVQLRNRMTNAFGQIDVQLKRRYDLVPNLVEVARGYLAHEAATLEAVIKARGQAQGAAAAARAGPTSAGAMGALAVAEHLQRAEQDAAEQIGRLHKRLPLPPQWHWRPQADALGAAARRQRRSGMGNQCERR